MYEWVLGGEENLERNEKKFKHQSPPKVLGQVELVLENVTETEEHLDMRPLEVNDSKRKDAFNEEENYEDADNG